MIPPHHVFVGPNRFGHPAGTFFPPRFGHGNRFGTVGFGHHHHFFDPFFFRNNCFGSFFDPFLCQGGFFASPVIWPVPIFWPDSSSNTYAADSNYAQQTAQAQQSDADLRAEIYRLTGEVEMLREEQQARNTPQQTSGPAPSSAPEQSTVLVFRDGRRAEIQNYGVVGQTLWIFSDKRARKLPLADLNLKATQEANAERGVEFLSGK